MGNTDDYLPILIARHAKIVQEVAQIEASLKKAPLEEARRQNAVLQASLRRLKWYEARLPEDMRPKPRTLSDTLRAAAQRKKA